MATFVLVEGANNGPSPRAGGPNTELALAQSIVNSMLSTSKKGATVSWVYDDVARTVTATISGTVG